MKFAPGEGPRYAGIDPQNSFLSLSGLDAPKDESSAHYPSAELTGIFPCRNVTNSVS